MDISFRDQVESKYRTFKVKSSTKKKTKNFVRSNMSNATNQNGAGLEQQVIVWFFSSINSNYECEECDLQRKML